MAARVESEGLRAVARQIGLDHKSVSKFLSGSRPRAPTRQKLERWYVRQIAGTATDAESARAALQVLVQDVAPGLRERAIREALSAFRQIYSRLGVPLPAWLQGPGEADPDRP